MKQINFKSFNTQISGCPLYCSFSISIYIQVSILHRNIMTRRFHIVSDYIPQINEYSPSFMTYHRVCNQINTTGVTSGAGTAYPFGASEFTPDFSGFRVTRFLVLCVCFVDRFCSFVLFPLAIVLSVLRFKDSDYSFGILWPLCCLSFNLKILITPLVFCGHCVVCPSI